MERTDLMTKHVLFSNVHVSHECKFAKWHVMCIDGK